MSTAGYAALFFTVVMLVTTAYFLMGGLPLLILAHDSPVDQKFISRFFEVYYKAALLGSVGAAISYALWNRFALAAGAAAIAALALILQRKILPAMSDIARQIEANDSRAIQSFRRVHTTALLLNLAQLVALIWGVTQIQL